MLDCHLNVWLIRPGRCLFKKLKPLSVGHVYLLEAFRSPYLSGGRVDLFDLAVAVKICSMDFQDGVQFLMQSPKEINSNIFWWGVVCKLRGFDFEKEDKAFQDYIKAYTDHAERWKKQDEKNTESCLPESIRVAWLLMAKVSESVAWNMPFARALSYVTAEAECNGQSFVTETQGGNDDG